jgi:hypothetical protein
MFGVAFLIEQGHPNIVLHDSEMLVPIAHGLTGRYRQKE